MVTCQSVNQLKTPAKVSWVFKMVSQFGLLATQSWGRLLIWQLLRRQSLTPFTRRESHKHSLRKKLAVHRVLYPSMLTESWVEGKSVEEKDAQPTERTAVLWGLSSNPIQEFGWTSQGMDWGWGQGIKSHHTQTCQGIWLQLSSEASYLGKEKKNWTIAQWCKILFSDESKFCISFGNQGPRVWRKGEEAHSPSCLKSSVKFPQSVMIWGAMLVLVHCVFWKPTSLHPFTKIFWSTLCFLLLTSFLKMQISFSSSIWHLPTLPKAPKVG